MWKWREWVIDAFNRNMPFDRFGIEQLAGDLIPNATVEQKLASGFNRNHMINYEGGAIPEEYQVEYVADRVDTTANVFMGLTVGCARCHDHKFDPISQKDYYRFFAFFNTIAEKGLDGKSGNAAPILEMPTAAQASEVAWLQQADRRARGGPARERDAAAVGGVAEDAPRHSPGAAARRTAGGIHLRREARRLVRQSSRRQGGQRARRRSTRGARANRRPSTAKPSWNFPAFRRTASRSRSGCAAALSGR